MVSSRKSKASDSRRDERLYAAVDQFEGPAELAKRVYHLGTPHFTDSWSHACLNMTGAGKPVFLFGRSFFDGLGDRELVFVLLHEAMHYAFRHHARRQERILAVWNIACDLVVNEFLLQRAGFSNIPDAGFAEFMRSAITFKNLQVAPPGKWLTLTAEETYNLLLEKRPGRLSAGADLVACDEHVWPETDIDASAGIAEELEDLIDEIQLALRTCEGAWGDASVGELRAIGADLKPISLNWDLILASRIASCLNLAYEQRWAPPSRKLAWMFPDILLPSDQQMEELRTSLIVAVDASGSISQAVLDRFIKIARSIPRDRVELRSVSFDTAIYPLDIWADPPGILGGGGTSFNVIEQFATELPCYPDLVVVLTDGHAARPAISRSDRWFWLITEDGTADHVAGIGRSYPVGELTSAHSAYDMTGCWWA